MEEVIGRLTNDVVSAFGGNLVALLLGGGYGGGEGGVVEIDGVEHPYNDLDLTYVVKHKRSIPWDSLTDISERYEEEIGIDIDFSRPLTLNDIRNFPRWQMWHDLLNSHIVLSGDKDILFNNVPDSVKEPPPAIEATRLLLNRGTGLLWAIRVNRGIEPAPDADFVRRNFYKCRLALGDALLIVNTCYASRYNGRDLLFAKLMEESDEVASFQLEEQYRLALDFKFRPDDVPRDKLTEEDLNSQATKWGEVFLYVERKRTGKDFNSLDDYIKWKGLRESEQHTTGSLIRNFIRNAQLRKLSLKYPRERLYRLLPVLLGLTGQHAVEFDKESEAYLKVWKRFN